MAGEKILVIDDEKIVYAAFKKELGLEGYEIDGALSGEEALEKVKEKKYALIFIDYHMPGGMNGVEACKAIRKIDSDLVLVFMTGTVEAGTTTEKEAEFIVAGGKVYYLYKPFLEGEILTVTKKALAGKGED